MRNHPLTAIFVQPEAFGNLALERSSVIAIGVNAVSGTVLMTAMAMSLLPLLTPALVMALGFLFGPLVAFFVTSLYARIEWRVGRRLGGPADLDDLYRLCSWFFLPISLAVLFHNLILQALPSRGLASSIAAALPSLIIVSWTLRTYTANLFRVQQFSRTRGCVGLVLVMTLFLVVVAGGLASLLLLLRYGAGPYLQSALMMGGVG